MSPTQVPEPILDRLRDDARFLITSHANPDGDAIGTSLGLARMLRSLGKTAIVWLRDAPASLYAPAIAGEPLVVGTEPPAGYPDDFDSVIVLECPALDRSGLAESLEALPQINIDHHLGNEHYGVVDWVDSSAPAVGEMVLRIARAMGVELDSETSTLLFMAVSTDTGGFRFANATECAFAAGADLVRSGARPEQVSQWLNESRPEAAIRLLGDAIQTLEIDHGGTVASILVTNRAFDRCGATQADSEGLIEVPRSVSGVETVAFLRELPMGGIKVSLRSRGDLDVESIARRHGGGGHKNAAGFNLESEDIETARSQIVAELGGMLEGV